MVYQIELKDLWTTQEPLEVKYKKYWLKLRVLDDDSKQKYYDILGGIKGKEPHIHFGVDLLGNHIFNEPRNKVQKIRKTIDSRLHGRISDETIILKDTPPKINFVLEVTPDGTSKESKITKFEITLDPPK